jgi:phosphoribosyl 1,2-cyclic phosphodiesterase
MEVVILGCGPSSAIPALRCVLAGTCEVCSEAHSNSESRNRRLNPSLLVRNTELDANILIDCGKTFRESVLRTLPQLGTAHVDAVILTHGHADACLGLDDLREVQKFDTTLDQVTGESIKNPLEPIGLHCSALTQQELKGKFDYLIEKEEEREQREANITPVPFRWVAKLQWKLFDWLAPFTVCGLQVVPFPVVHGKGYLSSAFEFGMELGVRFVYISDVSEFTDENREFLSDPSKPRIDVLIIDALYIKQYHSTHMNLENVLQEIRAIRPKRTLLTGMSHEFDYERESQTLREISESEGLVVEMAYDGLRLAFPVVGATN